MANAGAAFAEHLRQRSDRAAIVLAESLRGAGEVRRAEFLTAFVTRGEHAVAADWWAPGAVCHVSLDLPVGPGMGDLWFDPLQVDFALAGPWVELSARLDEASPIDSWMALQVVRPWQFVGAHMVAPSAPEVLAGTTPDDALIYCELFGQSLASGLDWR
ncbi:MAG: hypothetical protein ACK5MT_16695, partial [Actinomycetales bacterium]